MAPSPTDILRTVFGYDAFRGEQEEVIRHITEGHNAFVLMPTGGGKSLCYQIPALLRDGVAVVVSPLIALMQDQVAALTQLGVRAAALNSALGPGGAATIERDMRAGRLDLVYVAPERLMTEPFLHHLSACKIALFAIDEAHCVSQWGHDFRPEYRGLSLLPDRFPGVPLLALTATADKPTRRDIVEQLRLGEARTFVAGFDRPNIRYRVTPKRSAMAQLERFLEGHPGATGIVYRLSRNAVERTAAALAAKGHTALPYHAGLPREVRAGNQERFLKEDGIVMVATIALGMGIDKPDVRFVAHLDLPKSLEAYHQETGRAGRDGAPAEAWMVYGMEDVAKLRALADGSQAPDHVKRIERQKLDALLGYCETTRCRRQVLLEYFGDRLEEPCGNCDTCLEPVETFDGTEAARKALSCVYRTGQRFGAIHVIDVLVGAQTERIRTFRHDQLSTYGIGADLSRDAWRSVFRQLVAMGHLVVDSEGHGGLHLGPDCRPILRGETSIELRRDPAAAKGRSTRQRDKAGGAEAADLDDAQRAVFESLRALRRRLAEEQGVPPYIIFHDATLAAMARARPRSLEDMAGVPGIGAAKLERYGGLFLDALAGTAEGGRE